MNPLSGIGKLKWFQGQVALAFSLACLAADRMSSESFTKAWPDLRQRILEIVESGHSAAVELLLDKHPGLRAHEQLLIGCIYSEFCLQSRQHYRDRDEWSNGNQTATTFRTSAQSNDNIS